MTFIPGKSGNPAGRPKGSKHKIKTKFLDALAADFETHGEAVIVTVRTDSPLDYLKIVAGLLPKEEEHTHTIQGVRLWTEAEWLASLTTQESSSEPTTTESNATLSAFATDGQVKH